MRRILNRLTKQDGFTLVELVLYVVLTAILFNVGAQTMMTQVDAYAFVTDRKQAMSDVRFAINRISYDILRLELSDITSFDDDSIVFTDFNGANTSFVLAGTEIQKGGETLLAGVQSFEIIGYDEAGVETSSIADVRQFQFTIATQPKGDEGSVVVTTSIVPRTILYAGFE